MYSRVGLLSVFFWMLWGDLCVNIMETVVPRLVPLQLERLGAGKGTIGFVAVSVLAGVELAINPFVSTWSDRTRTRIGRRRPFILAGTPLLAACLVLVGLSGRLGPWLSSKLGMGPTGGPDITTIVLIGLLLAVFQVFNVIVLATYYYLIADVVPQQVIGKFASMYKVVGAMGGIVFNKYLFARAETHELGIYIGCAGIYLAAFLLMSWRVKEGEYPPPPPRANVSAGEAAGLWLKESFAIPFYQKLYVVGLFYYFATGSVLFVQFFALNDLGLGKERFGEVMAEAGLWSLPVFFVMGPISDRWHPLRAGMAGMGFMALSALASYFLIHDAGSFRVWTIVNAVATTVWLGAQISLMPRLLPLGKYGQYCSANNTLCALGKFGAPVLSGCVIQAMKQNRLTYLWTAVFSVLGMVSVAVVYQHWKQLGGDLNYQPPESEEGASGRLEVKTAPVMEVEETGVQTPDFK